MTKYARDEFDRVPETSTRQGVHRTVSASHSRRLGPILSFGAAALAIGLVAFLLLPRLGFGPAGGSAITADQASNNAATSQAATTGLAGRVGSTVASAGWVLGPLGNWGGARQQTSVVFYNGPAQKANAEALGSLLGIGTLVDSAELKMPLVVVLGPGFK